MKKTILLVTLALASISSMAQNTVNTATDLKTDYLQKSKNQKTAAWILVGTGTVALVSGFIVQANHAEDNTVGLFTGSQNNSGVIIALVGAGMAVGSIPLFLAAKKNKVMASLAFKTQSTVLFLPGKVNNRIPGLSLTMPLGK
jgi:hypothetical protein